MPIYDYQCNDCNKTYDVFHKVREVAEDVICPACGSMKNTRLLSAPLVVTGKHSSSGPADDFGGSCPTPGECCGGACGLN